VSARSIDREAGLVKGAALERRGGLANGGAFAYNLDRPATREKDERECSDAC
jgi:hypothetical protein